MNEINKIKLSKDVKDFLKQHKIVQRVFKESLEEHLKYNFIMRGDIIQHWREMDYYNDYTVEELEVLEVRRVSSRELLIEKISMKKR